MKPLDSVQRALVTKKCIIKPEQRYGKIMNIVNDLQFETDPYLKELNVRVDSKEMLQVRGKDRRRCRISFFPSRPSFEARVLPPPEVKYRDQKSGEITERVNCGKWVIRNRFFTTRDIKVWAMVYFGSKPDQGVIDVLKDFENRLPQVSSIPLISSRTNRALLVHSYCYEPELKFNRSR